MNCPNCGHNLTEGAKFCGNCGAVINEVAPQQTQQPEVPSQPIFEEPEQTQAPVQTKAPAQPQYVPPVQPVTEREITEDDLPEQYRPLSPWKYFGLQLLFAIPTVGFIFLIIFSFSKGNINRRNFARSYWCGLIIFGSLFLVAILIYVLLAIFVLGGVAVDSGIYY